MRILVTRPAHDRLTHYCHHWMQPVIDFAQSKKYKVFDLSKDKAVKKKLVSYLSKQAIDLVIMNGHGSDSIIAGHDNEYLIEATEDLSFIKGKNIFVRSCHCALALGPKMVAAGAKGFVGYTKPFWLHNDKECVAKPLADKIARPFLECSNQVSLSLLKGKTLQESHDESIARYNHEIAQLSSDSYLSGLVPFLMWNRDSQVCLT